MDIVEFLQYCRLPICFKADIRSMNVGDTFLVGVIKKYYEEMYLDAVAQAWFEKHRGHWSYHATWTLPTKPTRTDVMAFGSFKIKKGGEVVFLGDQEQHPLRSFSLVCRRIQYLLSRVSREENREWINAGVIPFFNGIRVNSDGINYRRSFVNNEPTHIQLGAEFMPTNSTKAICDKAISLGYIFEGEA